MASPIVDLLAQPDSVDEVMVNGPAEVVISRSDYLTATVGPGKSCRFIRRAGRWYGEWPCTYHANLGSPPTALGS